MAEIKSFPNNQDVYVGAEWVMKWLHGRTSGVFGAENNASVSAVQDSMSVQVSDGIGWLSNNDSDGVVWWNDSEKSNGSKLVLNLDTADGVLSRIDRVVVNWETTNYAALPTISILKGTASSNPVAPSLTNNNIQRQISLARIYIPAGTISLSNSLITDERLDQSVCGIVTERVLVDTSMVNSQVSELIEKLKEELANVEAGTAYVLKTGDTMTGPLAMSGNRITGLTDPVDESDAVTKSYADTRVAYNLVDNSDFLHFVAQAEIGGTHGAKVYAGDRWILDSGEVTGEKNANGDGYSNITLNGTIRQIVSNPPTGNYVCGIEMVSGTATISYADGEVIITSAGGVIRGVTLVEGNVLPKYVPKGYIVELIECQKYYIQLHMGYQVIGSGYATAVSEIRILIPLCVNMRITPTVNFIDGSISDCKLTGGGSQITPSAISAVVSRGAPGQQLKFTVSGAASKQTYVLTATTSFVIAFCADL